MRKREELAREVESAWLEAVTRRPTANSAHPDRLLAAALGVTPGYVRQLIRRLPV
jgi:hypothetical protein